MSALHRLKPDADEEQRRLRVSLCGMVAVQVSEDDDAVTCKLCLDRMPMRPTERVILEVTSDTITVGPVQRGQHLISPSLLRIIERSRLGDHEWRKRFTWRSAEIAIQSLVAFRADGQPLRSSSRWRDPREHVDCERHDQSERVTEFVDRLVHVQQAMDRAYASERRFDASVDEDGQERPAASLDVAMQGVLLRISIAGGAGFTGLGHHVVAERMKDAHAISLTDKQVAIVRNEGVRSVAAHLRSLGELEPAEEDRHVVRREGNRVGVPGCDLSGWKAIAALLGLSESTCRKLSERERDPLPICIIDGLRGVGARSHELLDWAERNRQRRAG